MGRRFFKKSIAMVLSIMMVIAVLPVAAFAGGLSAPTVSAAVESIIVSNFTSGATLKLYLNKEGGGATLVKTESNVTADTFIFTDVEPNPLQYYVTQTVDTEESVNSDFINSILRTPVATAGVGYIDASNIYLGATVTLYKLNGSIESTTPTANGDGTFRFSDLTPGEQYYLQQSINGVVSAGSNAPAVLFPPAPTVVAGLESIEVSNFTSGVTLKLYLREEGGGAAVVKEKEDATGSTYTFENVEPNSLGYYVTQSIATKESVNSTFVNSILRTPVANAGVGYIDASNIYPNATVNLYTNSGVAVLITPTDNGNGTFRFSGLISGGHYFLQQSINNVVSEATNIVTVPYPNAPNPPSVEVGLESIKVKDFTPGATLKLYFTTGAEAAAEAVGVTDATYTFENVEPNVIQYYVTQKVNGVESVNSTFVNSKLRTPVLTSGVGYLDVSNVYPHATLRLYTFEGDFVSDTPIDNNNGTFRFANLTAGQRYYVIQSINEVVSEASTSAKIITVPSAPTNVTAVVVNKQIRVSFSTPADNGGSTITSYSVISNQSEIPITGTSTTINISGLSRGISYKFKVRAVNIAGAGAKSEESNAVVIPKSSSTDESSPSVSLPDSDSGAIAIVNGEPIGAGTLDTQLNSNGQAVSTFIVDSAKLKEQLENERNGSTVVIPITGSAEVAVGQLNGQMVKDMEQRAAVLEVRTGNVSYVLPAAEINIDEISGQFGTSVSLSDINVSVSISTPPSDMVRAVETAARNGGFTNVGTPVAFDVVCSYNGRTAEVNRFNGYVERSVALPSGVDPSKITTGVVVNPDATLRHVPTQVSQIGGNYYSRINSLTNSVYTLVWNPVTFKDVENHWAKDSINNMGSRMVVSGVGDGNYNPDGDITRAEFAAIVVRALGLEPGMGENSFDDVKAEDWFCQYVATASEYGIIKGYDEDTFAPNGTITREQAMAMVARAMKITGIEQDLTEDEINSLLSAYIDGESVSSYARTSIAACLKAEIMWETETNTLKPNSKITRAEVAVILENLLKKSNLI